MWHWEASQAIRWPPLCFLSTEVVVHIFFGYFLFFLLNLPNTPPPIPTATLVCSNAS